MTTHILPRNVSGSSALTTDHASSSEQNAKHLLTQIGRTYRFEAAHHLPLLPATHKCHNMHGHNYRVEIVVCGIADERGFVMDFAELDAEILPLITRTRPQGIE